MYRQATKTTRSFFDFPTLAEYWGQDIVDSFVATSKKMSKAKTEAVMIRNTFMCGPEADMKRLGLGIGTPKRRYIQIHWVTVLGTEDEVHRIRLGEEHNHW